MTCDIILVSGVLHNDLTPGTFWNDHHVKLLQYYWPYSLGCMLYPMADLFCNWKSVPLNPLYPFPSTSPDSPLATTCSSALWVSLHFGLLVHFLDSMYKWDHTRICLFQHNALWTRPRCHKRQDVILFLKHGFMYLAVLVGGCGAQASPAVERGLLSPCGVRPVGHPAAVVTVQGPQLWRTGLLALRHVASSQTRNQPCVHLQANSFNRWTTRDVPFLFFWLSSIPLCVWPHCSSVNAPVYSLTSCACESPFFHILASTSLLSFW